MGSIKTVWRWFVASSPSWVGSNGNEGTLSLATVWTSWEEASHILGWVRWGTVRRSTQTGMREWMLWGYWTSWWWPGGAWSCEPRVWWRGHAGWECDLSWTDGMTLRVRALDSQHQSWLAATQKMNARMSRENSSRWSDGFPQHFPLK